MKTNTALLLKTLFIFILTSCGFSTPINAQKNDWELDGLKGKVKSFTNYEYETIEDGENIEKGIYTFFSFGNYQNIYDEKGNKTEENLYEGYGFVGKKIYMYDNNEKLIEKKQL